MAVLALELGTREPHFTLVLQGEPLLTAASHTAPFHTLLLLLHAANTAHGAGWPGPTEHAVRDRFPARHRTRLHRMTVARAPAASAAAGKQQQRPHPTFATMHRQDRRIPNQTSGSCACAGAIGGRSLEYLRLAPVVRPVGRVRDLFAGRWFGTWT